MKKICCILLFCAPILRGAIWAQNVKVTFKTDTLVAQNPLQKEGWALLWHDEFDVDSIDYAHWWVQDAERKGESAYFTQRLENVRIKNGKLLISVLKEPYKNYSYTGGLVYASRQIDCNSYVEASLKIPKGKGFWPAFWFHGGIAPNYQEVDALETYGSQTTKVDVTNHYSDSTKTKVLQDWRRVSLKKANGKDFDLADGLNVFGFEWTDNLVRVYLNNQLLQEINQNVPTTPMNLVLGMGVGGSAGKPNRRTPFPSTYEIDYVRVYKKNKAP